jgi:hypothetical protein
MATCPDARLRNGKQAVESASRACELTGWKVAQPLATLAAAYAENGDFERAVEWQTKANELSSTSNDRSEGAERLALYRSQTAVRDAAH